MKIRSAVLTQYWRVKVRRTDGRSHGHLAMA